MATPKPRPDPLAGRIYVDALAGLELGGVPIATALSLRWGVPARSIRKG